MTEAMNPKTVSYNRLAGELMPHFAAELTVPGNLNFNHIDERIFRKGEYLGGMAAVLIALAEKEHRKDL